MVISVGGGSPFSVKVEKKIFSFRLTGNGKEVVIEEGSRGRTSVLSLLLGLVAWVRDCFEAIGAKVKVERFFRRWNSSVGFI